MDCSTDMMLVVNRAKERMNKFRKKTANGDISSKENYYECCVFELKGTPKIAFQDDVTRNASMHDVNLNEVRELVLALMGKKINIPKYFKLNNAPFVRRIVHLHIAEVPAATNPNTTLSKGGPQALLAGLSLGGVKCIRVDKEIDEQGLLPYKLLTVPYSKHHELALSTAETCTTSNTSSITPSSTSTTGNGTSATGAADTAKSVGAAQTEEQQAYHTLLPYVLSPAQLHLWNYPTDKLLTPSHASSLGGSHVSTDVENSASTVHIDSSTGDDEQPTKRARTEPSISTTPDSTSIVSKGVTRGAEYLPTPAEAQQVLSALNTTTGWVATNTTTTTNASTNTLLIAAIDCEMCETCQGSELARISVLTFEGIVVFDSLVKPKNAITNYQTQYSGITEEILRDVNVTLQQVQVALLRLLSSATLLVGHSLDSDLRALRLVHAACVDTALLYPHPRGFPMRLKLKKLAEDYLQLRIQGNAAKGHDSTEDAKAALQLALLKGANGPLFGVKNPDQQRFALMSVLDPVSTQSVLVWTGEGKSSGGTGGSGSVVKEVSEVVVAENSAGGISVAAGTTTVVADTNTTSYGADSCVGGNARTVQVDNNATAVSALCAQLSSPSDSETYAVSTTEDKSLGPISSWVSNPRAAGSDVKTVQVPKKSYLFARLEHTSGAESDAFPAELSKQIELIRTTITAADAARGLGPGTLLLVTAQESLSHVLALIQRKRVLSKATMAAAMWSAEDELRLRELRKHNLAYMTTAIV